MYFRQILHEEKSCISYVVGCPTMKVCAVIDPQGDRDEYIARVNDQNLQIVTVIETHIQADHLSSARELAKKTNATLCFGPGATVPFPHKQLKDGEIVTVGNRNIKIIHTPGHTKEHVCLLVDGWFVLTGDTLFVGDVGRVDLSVKDEDKSEPVMRAEQLYDSLQKLSSLPDWTEVYPGHYSGSVCGKGMDGKPISTIGWEKVHNDVLRLRKKDFMSYLAVNVPPFPADFQQIKKKNMGI